MVPSRQNLRHHRPDADQGDLVRGSAAREAVPTGDGLASTSFEKQVVLRELVRRRERAPSRPQSERNFRRAITETPRHNAEVILS